MYIQTILKEIDTVLRQVEENQLQDIALQLKKANRIFVIGEGRSGLMAKSFAMRLMHLGATVYVVGETITPSIASGDLLVAISGSGTTKNVVWTAEKSRSLGCSVIAMTTNPESALAEVSTEILHVPAATKYRRENEIKTIQPLGSLFDQCAHIIFDTLCLQFSKLNEVDHTVAFGRHSNLE
ncbi:6-phospho-3-hexuloisomerase [Neobacillus thermocopriae]|uniref:6-phospho-3-hexuloisomerase n=1 Tax=Neobacillus thermocopriae TaxID=1215031 RepID=A0A6B3TT52_9BACI|nr:6-phospho-3-hexuloisomerase [Neobacillus thermocopriae]NEX79668.1 6-phospho-3-hexuloisomerase [Neobacillus thermocopriae]